MSLPTILSQISISFLVSFITSIIVSTISFVLGVRMAKNQTDRIALRDTYKTIFKHFDNLKESIERREPIHWGKYKFEKNYRNTPLRELKTSGQSNLIPQSFMEQIEKVENEALSAAGRYSMWIDDNFYDPADKLLKQLEIRPGQMISGRTIFPYDPIKLGLADSESLSNIKTGGGDRNIGFSISIKPEQGKPQQYYIYPDNVDHRAYNKLIDKLRSIIFDNDEGRKLVNDVLLQPEELASTLDELKSRIRDPHPLYESIVQSFKDIMGRK